MAAKSRLHWSVYRDRRINLLELQIPATAAVKGYQIHSGDPASGHVEYTSRFNLFGVEPC